MSNTLIIAEVGQAHDGSLGILHSYIDAISKTGVNAIKFQTHIAQAESSQKEEFRTNFSYEDNTRYQYWDRMSFTKDQWVDIKKHCEDVGLEFISSPFSVAAVKLLESIGMQRYKIGSGEINNYLMLDAIAKTGKPIILSSGMSSFKELEDTIDFLSPYGNKLSLMQCTTSYPTPAERVGLNVLTELKERFAHLPIGLSDHSGTIYPSLAAVTLGAELLEFHAVFHKEMFGPDATSSLTVREISELVEAVRFIEKMVDNPVNKDDVSHFSALKTLFGKSLTVNKDLSHGHVISIEDLESTKPGNEGIAAKDFKTVLGRELKRKMSAHDFLNYSDLQ